MDAPSGPAREPVAEPRSFPKQRWRLVLARSTDAPELGGRDLADAWDAAIAATGLPLHRSTPDGRARVAWAAPLPGRMAAERELAEIVLAEAVPVWRVRDELTRCMPAGWSLVDVHDVWLGAPALAGRITGAVYRVGLDAVHDPAAIQVAAATLISAAQLLRTRAKGGTSVEYDLRPLLAGIDVVHAGPPVVVRIRTRMHPQRGSGRPEEVIAALGDQLSASLAIEWILRERLLVDDDPA